LNLESNLVAIPLPQFQQLTPGFVGVTSNGLLAISAPVVGVGPFTYQWYFNGTRINGATNDSYQLPNAGTGNQGNYHLVAHNSAGSSTNAAVNISFLDVSGSGLPVAWELYYFGHTGVNPAADPDGDGVSNYNEYVDGTNPTNALSVMPRLYVQPSPGGTATITPFKAKYQLNDAVQVTALPYPGQNFLGWFGSITNTNATVNLVMNTSKTLTMQLGLPLTQVLDNPNLVWTTGGAGGWFGQTNVTSDGISAAQSGGIFVGQQTWLQTSIVATGLTEVAFQWAVSSEQNKNFLDFDINGVTSRRLSGGQGQILWTRPTFLLTPGSTSISWVYAQTAPDTDYGWINLDTGWLDQVQVTPLVMGPGLVDVIGWGSDTNRQTEVPPGLTNVVGIAAGQGHSVALNKNGTVVAWGYNADGEINVPASAVNVTAVASGWFHNLALRQDGTVVAWGKNNARQTNVPPGLTNVVAVSAGSSHSLALNRDGTVVAWGDNTIGQSTVPSDLTNVVAIAAGGQHSTALKGDGTVLVWGDTSTSVPAGLANVAAIAAGAYFNLALIRDGTVVAWGNDYFGQNFPTGLSNVVAIAAGFDFSLALKSDGTVVAWGDDNLGQIDVPTVPAGYGNYQTLAAGGAHTLGVLNTGAPFIAREPVNQIIYSGTTALINAGAVGAPPLSYQWKFNGNNLAGARDWLLALPSAQVTNSGAYSVLVTNSLGSVLRSNELLTVVNSKPILLTQPASLSVLEGDSVPFSTVAVGSLPLSYQWRFAGTNLPGATESSLALTNVTTAQGGAYDLVVTNLYGSVTSSVATLVVAANVTGVVFSNLYSFGTLQDLSFHTLDGAMPYAALALGPDGNLYGTTSGGGSNFNSFDEGFGTVFRITPGGSLTGLYSFGAIQDTNYNGLDGAIPRAGLTVGSDGDLYGTTSEGGTNIYMTGRGFGTVFKITTDGKLTSLYSFGTVQDGFGEAMDGSSPQAALLAFTDGALYGTASGGGSNFSGSGFRVTTNGTLTISHLFGTLQDAYASSPEAALITGNDGYLYGTSSSGGTNFSGSIFRMSPGGSATGVYSFGALVDTNGNALDGSSPQAPLLLASDGNYYGETTYGGAHTFGTIFRLTPSGALTTLYSFGSIQDTNGQPLDGYSPLGGLVQGNDGKLYGVTSYGGTYNNGTVFQVSTSGVLATLHRFLDGNEGSNPQAGLLLVGNTLYGTTSTGGTHGDGTVFTLTLASAATPNLAIQLVDSEVILTWPTTASSFSLQTATNLPPIAIWTPVTPAPVVVNGQYTVTNAVANRQAYYRLAR
jgi:uncharacterized repeat protein (TIGR03803 family)